MSGSYFTCGQELGCARYINGANRKGNLTPDACFGMVKLDAKTNRYTPVCKGHNQPECAVSKKQNSIEEKVRESDSE
jgi:hypothetical protein